MTGSDPDAKIGDGGYVVGGGRHRRSLAVRRALMKPEERSEERIERGSGWMVGVEDSRGGGPGLVARISIKQQIMFDKGDISMEGYSQVKRPQRAT